MIDIDNHSIAIIHLPPPKGNRTAWYRVTRTLRPLPAGQTDPGWGLSAAGSIQPLETAPGRRNFAQSWGIPHSWMVYG